MKVKKIMRRVILVVMGVIALLIAFVIYVRLEENYYENKYNNTPKKSTVTSIKGNWGKPTSEFVSATKESPQRKVVKYNKGLIGFNTYIFIFNENEDLVFKAIDD